MRTLLSEARIFLAPNIAGGSSPSSQRVLSTINEAMLRMHHKVTLSSQLVRWKVVSQDGVIIPPRQIESLYGARRAGQRPAKLYDQFVEFCGSGPGELSPKEGYDSMCVNKGVSPLYFDIPQGCKLEAVSNASADNNLIFTIRGKGSVPLQTYTNGFTSPAAGGTATLTVQSASGFYANNRACVAGIGSFLIQAITGNNLTVKNDQNLAVATAGTALVFANIQPLPAEEVINISTVVGQGSRTFWYNGGISYIAKPVTAGQVFVYGYDIGTGNRYLLAILDKDETLPEYKRYLLPGMHDFTGCVEVLGKKRFIPVRNDTDELPIGNLEALKLMCLAIYQESKENYQAAVQLEQRAVSALEFEDRSGVGGSMPMLGVRMMGVVKNQW